MAVQNLVPLQLDKSTGKLVATSGISTNPPTGTGYAHVTNGVLDVAASTPAQVTADLNLFTSGLKGLVPASGGGTSTFLRADGTWVSPNANAVTSFNTRTGAVTLTSGDVSSALGFTPGSVTSVAAVAGTGISVTGSPITGAGTLTITNTGVTSVIAGTGIAVSAASGPVTITNLGVTSVSLADGSATPVFSITGTPVTNTGTLILSLLPQSANRFLAGPLTGANAQPTFRALTTADLPAGTGTVTSVALTASPGLTVTGSPITTNGTLALTLSAELQGLSGLSTNGVVQRTGTGSYVALTNAQLTAMLVTFSTSTSAVGVVPGSNGATTQFLRGDGTWATPAGSGTVTSVGVSSTTNAISVGNSPVTSSGVINITANVFTGSDPGVVPASGGGTTNFLRSDGTWTTPAGAGTVTSVAATGSTGLTVGGSPITSSGTLTFTLSAELQGLSALATTGFVQRTGLGTYTSANLSSGQVTTALGFTPGQGTVTSVIVAAGAGVSVTGSPITTSGTITVTNTGVTSLAVGANTGLSVSSGTGGVTISGVTFTSTLAGVVPASGGGTTNFLRSDGTWTTPAGGGTVSSVAATGSTGLTVGGSPITGSGTLTFTLGAELQGLSGLAANGIVQRTGAGTYTSANLSSGQVTTALGFTPGQGTVTSVGVTSANAAITVTGSPVTGAGSIAITSHVFTTSAQGDAPASGGGTTNFLRADGTWAAPAGGGTVTSVALTAPSFLTVAGSPVTTTGTLALTLATQAANTVFAGPTTGSAAAPTFRALVAADVPTNGVERVVWRYAPGNQNAFSSSIPVSITSGVSIAAVTAGNSTATYAFTGYDHPPVTITVYGQQTDAPSPGQTQWSGVVVALNYLMADTGTNTAPNLLTSFTTSNTLTFQCDGTVSNATDAAGTGAFMIIEFKF